MSFPSDSVAQRLREASAALSRREWARAQALCQAVLRDVPEHFGALSLLGAVAAETGDPASAAGWLRRAAAANPAHPGAASNLGVVLQQLGQREEALACFERAIALKEDVPEAHNNRGFLLRQLGRLEEALRSVDRAIALRPGYAEAHNNRGNVLHQCRRFDEAVASYDAALALQPGYAEAHYNRGLALQESGRSDAALPCYDRALELRPAYGEAWRNRGLALLTLGRDADALESFSKGLLFDPGQDYLAGMRLWVRLKLAEWTDYDRLAGDLVAAIGRGERAAPPFVVLSVTDSPSVQRRAAETWVDDRFPAAPAMPPAATRGRSDRLRIGYFSTDFYRHALTHLLAEMFEQHDKSRFEVIGFRLGSAPEDDLTRRVAAAFDRFVDARTRSDDEVAALARSMEIDVAVDLNGHTEGARTGIFARRAAPVQVSYMGYPGTTGASYIDYVLADRVLIPPGSRDQYSERVVCLPGSYQVNDGRRPIAERTFTREALGLPATGFVFCCFNHTAKITPQVFGVWMELLHAVPRSVLWLLQGQAQAVANLRKEAGARRIDPTRLVFAPRLPAPEHLARHRAADLFVDTFPYTAHTTASDALWAGLPLLTRTGDTFASRVAASLLHAVGLPELVTTTVEDYRSLAIALATDAPRLRALGERLQRNRATSTLFDSARFCRHLESAFVALHERQRQGLPPADLDVPA